MRLTKEDWTVNTRFVESIAGTMALLLIAATALAADLTGIWAGHITDPNGENHDLSLKLKLDGNKVTGTIKGGPPTGEQQPLSGELEGDQLSFDVKGPGGASTYKGKVNGNHIAGTMASPAGPLPWEVSKK
jgi:hypothetical protein